MNNKKTKPLLKTIDDVCGLPSGSFKKYIKEQQAQEAKEHKEYRKRILKSCLEKRKKNH